MWQLTSTRPSSTRPSSTALDFVRNAVAHAGFQMRPDALYPSYPVLATICLWNFKFCKLMYAEIVADDLLKWLYEQGRWGQ